MYEKKISDNQTNLPFFLLIIEKLLLIINQCADALFEKLNYCIGYRLLSSWFCCYNFYMIMCSFIGGVFISSKLVALLCIEKEREREREM